MHTHTLIWGVVHSVGGNFPLYCCRRVPFLNLLKEEKNLFLLPPCLLKLLKDCPLGLEVLHIHPPLPHSLFSSSSSFSSSSCHTQSFCCLLPCDPFTTRPPSVFHRSPIRSWCHTSNSPFMHVHKMFTMLLTRSYRKRESCQVWMRLSVFLIHLSSALLRVNMKNKKK